LLPWLLFTGDYAAKNKDNNLFSSLDDNNNFGSAFTGTVLLGTKNLTKKSAWLSGTYSYISPIITDAVVSAFNLNTMWDDTTKATNAGQRQSWESTAGASMGNNTSAEASYGQYINGSHITTDRAGVKIQYMPRKPLTLVYDGSFFRHFIAQATNTTLRDIGQALYSSEKIDATFTYNDEWRTIADSLNRGTLGAGVVLTLRPASLTQEITYHVFRKGDNSLFAASDTGHSILWNQTFKHTFSPAWTSSLSSNYNLESRYGKENSTTVLVTAANDVSLPSKGFSLQQKYQVTMEKAATYAQVPVYVGAGLGNYAWNDSLQQYMPAKNGDFVIQEQELYGSVSDNRIRKTQLSASWSLNRTQKRLPGILGDVDWFGTLNIEENLRLDAPLPALSWLPAYTSLFKHNSLTDTMIPSAALSYRQTINWNPDSIPNLKGTFYVQPSLNKIRDYSDRGTECGGTLEKTVGQWVFGGEATLTGVQRQGVSVSTDNTYQVNDRKLELDEKRLLSRNFTLYIKETSGWAQKKSANADNSGWYSRCTPGILWQPAKKGQAELSYTYSTVSIPGTLDYRMAQGFAAGTTHVVNATMHMIFGTRFSGDIMYKGEFGNKSYAKSGLHVVSMQMKAFL